MIKKPALLPALAAALLLAASALPATAPAFAAGASAKSAGAGQSKMGQGAEDFVNGMGQKALNFLRNRTMNMERKKDEFRNLLQGSFDMDTIGRFTLGTYWRTASAAQQKEFLQLFREMVVNVYSARFQEYKGQKFEARSYRVESDKDTIVTSFIMPSNEPEVQVDWRVRSKNGSYKIVDVIVEGVSMSVTQRSDFASVIQRGGGDVEALLKQMRQQTAGGPATVPVAKPGKTK
jgi:phospholipid transport system substrate-binding protein